MYPDPANLDEAFLVAISSGCGADRTFPIHEGVLDRFLGENAMGANATQIFWGIFKMVMNNHWCFCRNDKCEGSFSLFLGDKSCLDGNGAVVERKLVPLGITMGLMFLHPLGGVQMSDGAAVKSAQPIAQRGRIIPAIYQHLLSVGQSYWASKDMDVKADRSGLGEEHRFCLPVPFPCRKYKLSYVLCAPRK